MAQYNVTVSKVIWEDILITASSEEEAEDRVMDGEGNVISSSTEEFQVEEIKEVKTEKKDGLG